MRVNITLECTSCHERTYLTSKNRRNNPDRLEQVLPTGTQGYAAPRNQVIQS